MKLATKILPIGLWQRDNLVDVAWIEKPKQIQKHKHLPYRPRPKCITTSLMPTETLLDRIVEKMDDVPNFRKVQPLLISAVPPHFVWEKAIVVPQKNLSDEECRQQCQSLLQAELPVPLDKVWFDYHSSAIKQGTLIEMSAVLIEHATERRLAFLPLPIQIMDSVSHALMRAFQYFEEDLPKETIYLYIDDDYGIIMQEKGYDFNVLQVSEIDPENLIKTFCERFNVEADSVCIHTKNETEAVNALIAQKQWTQVKTTQPFIAFGLALWTVNFG